MPLGLTKSLPLKNLHSNWEINILQCSFLHDVLRGIYGLYSFSPGVFSVGAENTENRVIQGWKDKRAKILRILWRNHKCLRLGTEEREAKGWVCVCVCDEDGRGGYVEAQDRRSSGGQQRNGGWVRGERHRMKCCQTFSCESVLSPQPMGKKGQG